MGIFLWDDDEIVGRGNGEKSMRTGCGQYRDWVEWGQFRPIYSLRFYTSSL